MIKINYGYHYQLNNLQDMSLKLNFINDWNKLSHNLIISVKKLNNKI